MSVIFWKCQRMGTTPQIVMLRCFRWWRQRMLNYLPTWQRLSERAHLS